MRLETKDIYGFIDRFALSSYFKQTLLSSPKGINLIQNRYWKIVNLLCKI